MDTPTALDDVLLDIESALTSVQRRAMYARFVGAHPDFRGAFLPDMLDHMIETDAHALFIGSLDADAELVPSELREFYRPAFLALLYSEGQPPTHDEVMDLVYRASEVSA